MYKYIFTVLLFSFYQNLFSQTTGFTFSKQDTLRGTITLERAWWDLKFYQLNIKVNPQEKNIIGSNLIRYQVLDSSKVMQIDLQLPLKITKVVQDGRFLKFERDSNVYLIHLEARQEIGQQKEITIYYNGIPTEAVHAPWDGGIVWDKDKNGAPFIASACQGIGASIWWPNKDHMYDEVDSMVISVNVPEDLIDVSNGHLVDVSTFEDKTKTYTWRVRNPISNYGVSINIADYGIFMEKYHGEKGVLDCRYYVLRENLPKAKIQFKEVGRMLKAFEHWFGPYPFYEDGYKLVETPYVGMEHQSCVTYGNDFKNGYKGLDLSGTGWGLKFDFIIIHESAHEWFANNITYKDIADMWIHESFANYAECLFLEYYYGKKAGNEYVIGLRDKIKNDIPIIGIYGVNNRGSEDMYFKGANMLQMLRQVVADDEKWRAILRGLNSAFYHQTVTTAQIEAYLSKEVGIDLNPFFNQYLRDVRIPQLEYYCKGGQLAFRWTNCVDGFNIPVKILLDGKDVWVKPVAEIWDFVPVNSKKNKVQIDTNFYILTKNVGAFEL